MQREKRYVVLKQSDIENLTEDAKQELDDICRFINRQRLMAGKTVLQCVVVEHDWPEYEAVWRMIEARVDGCGCREGECESKLVGCRMAAEVANRDPAAM